MSKQYRIYWNEIITYTTVIEADSEEEAERIFGYEGCDAEFIQKDFVEDSFEIEEEEQ